MKNCSRAKSTERIQVRIGGGGALFRHAHVPQAAAPRPLFRDQLPQDHAEAENIHLRQFIALRELRGMPGARYTEPLRPLGAGPGRLRRWRGRGLYQPETLRPVLSAATAADTINT